MTITTQHNHQQLEDLRSDLRRAFGEAQQAWAALPRMTVDWFGPASEAWRQTEQAHRARLSNLLNRAEGALLLSERVGR